METPRKKRKNKPGLVRNAPKDTAITFEIEGVRVSIFREKLSKLRFIATKRLDFIDPQDLTPPPPSH